MVEATIVNPEEWTETHRKDVDYLNAVEMRNNGQDVADSQLTRRPPGFMIPNCDWKPTHHSG